MDDDEGLESATADLRAALAKADRDARHPALRLSWFVVEQLDDDDVLEDPDELDDLGESVPEAVRRDARVRRGALIEAAMQVIERCLNDLEGAWFDDDGVPDPEWVDESLVFEAFPPRHRSAYNRGFFRSVLVAAVKVGHDLADPNGGPPACTAEEILRSHIGQHAVMLCELAGVDPSPLEVVDDILVEDVDFEVHFDDSQDGLESDPAHQAAIGLEVVPVSEWFTPFNDSRIVHPFIRTDPAGELELHDLRRRLIGLDREVRERVDWSTVNDSAPLVGMEPVSEVVALARSNAAANGESGVWVADHRDAEESFGELVRALTLSPSGSGWLTWEPHHGAGTVRTSAVLSASARRHFPVGPDEPNLEASLGARIVVVPLGAVVSYEPDPEPRRRWEEAMSLPS